MRESVARLLLFLFLRAVVSTVKAGAEDSFYYQEIQPTRSRYESDPAWQEQDDHQQHKNSTRIQRKRTWWGRKEDDDPQAFRESNHDVVHPLRSSRYQVKVQWKSKLQNLPNDLQLELDPDTMYCRLTSSLSEQSSSTTTIGLGIWQVHPWGLWMEVDLWLESRNANAINPSTFTWTSQMVLNPFGSHAKLVQGTILQNHPSKESGSKWDAAQDYVMVHRYRKWFRPVVGRFSGTSLEP